MDKSIQETLNLTLKVVDNLLKTPGYAQVSACYPQALAQLSKNGSPLGTRSQAIRASCEHRV